jgi:hypothetical protein
MNGKTCSRHACFARDSSVHWLLGSLCMAVMAFANRLSFNPARSPLLLGVLSKTYRNSWIVKYSNNRSIAAWRPHRCNYASSNSKLKVLDKVGTSLSAMSSVLGSALTKRLFININHLNHEVIYSINHDTMVMCLLNTRLKYNLLQFKHFKHSM